MDSLKILSITIIVISVLFLFMYQKCQEQDTFECINESMIKVNILIDDLYFLMCLLENFF